jgi:hypothetical protein
MDQMDIMKQLESNYNTSSAVETLMQMDFVLDRLNVYAYANWLDGEVVDGPHIEPYWVTVTLMYPHKLMPDPDAAQRITDWGGRVFYAKDTLITAAKLVTPEDSDGVDGADEMRPGQPRAKKVERKIWLVTLELPRDSMDSMTADQQELVDNTINNDAVEEAYDEDLGENNAE